MESVYHLLLVRIPDSQLWLQVAIIAEEEKTSKDRARQEQQLQQDQRTIAAHQNRCECISLEYNVECAVLGASTGGRTELLSEWGNRADAVAPSWMRKRRLSVRRQLTQQSPVCTMQKRKAVSITACRSSCQGASLARGGTCWGVLH